QAEDGIRYRNVTGVQTCALPISCIGNHITAHDVFNENIEINNNTFEDCYVGVRPYKWNIVKVTDNIFTRNDECISISSVGGNYEIGRASCRERGAISLDAVAVRK